MSGHVIPLEFIHFEIIHFERGAREAAITMNRCTPASATLAIALALCCAVAPVWAQGLGNGRERNEPPQAREQHDRGRDQGTLSDSVRRVERDTRGQILSAERVPFDGREMHRVKVLDDRGRVRVYMDDPRQRRDGAEPPRRPTRGNDD